MAIFILHSKKLKKKKKHEMLTKSSLDSKTMRNVVLPPPSPLLPLIWSLFYNIFILY